MWKVQAILVLYSFSNINKLSHTVIVVSVTGFDFEIVFIKTNCSNPLIRLLSSERHSAVDFASSFDGVEM